MLKKAKTIGVMAMMFSMLLLLCACGNNSDDVSEAPETVVLEFGDYEVDKGEVYIYICTLKEKYEQQYGEDVWDTMLPTEDNEGVTVENLTREEVINDIIKVKILISHADDYGVALSDEDINQITTKSDEFYSGLTDEDKRSMEMTRDLVYNVMYENALAKKVEEKLLSQHDIEISDEEARMTTFYDMYFNCYMIDEDGVMVAFTEEEREKQYENAIMACSTLATAEIDNDENAGSIEKLAEYYNLTEAKEYTLTPEAILNTYGQEIYDLLYSMKNGDYSTVIESEYGYHVFQMIELTDQKATAANKLVIEEQRTEEYLQETLDVWKNKIDQDFKYPESVNMDIYDEIKLR